MSFKVLFQLSDGQVVPSVDKNCKLDPLCPIVLAFRDGSRVMTTEEAQNLILNLAEVLSIATRLERSVD